MIGKIQTILPRGSPAVELGLHECPVLAIACDLRGRQQSQHRNCLSERPGFKGIRLGLLRDTIEELLQLGGPDTRR